MAHRPVRANARVRLWRIGAFARIRPNAPLAHFGAPTISAVCAFGAFRAHFWRTRAPILAHTRISAH